MSLRRYAACSISSVVTATQSRFHASARREQSSNSEPASDGDTAVTAVAVTPSVEAATYARREESAPPLNATTTCRISRKASRRAANLSERSALSTVDAAVGPTSISCQISTDRLGRCPRTSLPNSLLRVEVDLSQAYMRRSNFDAFVTCNELERLL